MDLLYTLETRGKLEVDRTGEVQGRLFTEISYEDGFPVVGWVESFDSGYTIKSKNVWITKGFYAPTQDFQKVEYVMSLKLAAALEKQVSTKYHSTFVYSMMKKGLENHRSAVDRAEMSLTSKVVSKSDIFPEADLF